MLCIFFIGVSIAYISNCYLDEKKKITKKLTCVGNISGDVKLSINYVVVFPDFKNRNHIIIFVNISRKENIPVM